ncbi:glycosyltransferase 87 family protein [Rhodococcus sp. H29-C3]|uniref:glycosyltransferase 87 family protein n=1 Tax=Rhodococcus sp. H29-C3 TaxID=3046307 RepID=UPI0024BA1008|nr:glycosyltransferase 87 family protein [Rhodococcus sp. H29-C3]MDJ0363349.1 glycosyltransferase 87 family protein [Rhodococcus sp. H29-C3]
MCACIGYLSAAGAVAYSRSHGKTLSILAAATGAVLVPLFVLVSKGLAQSEVEVVERAGLLTLAHGTPYLSTPLNVDDVTPYLPGMALFGFPRAVLGETGEHFQFLGDARLWFAAAFFSCLWLAWRVLGSSASGLAGITVVASPVVAMPLAVSGIDLPIIGLLCLAIALADRRHPAAAGIALALACSMKWTAWPAVVIVAVLLANSAGSRAAARSVWVAVGGTALVILPSALLSPRPLVEQVFGFTTGRSEWVTPAASPLPGRLLADLGPAGWYAATGLLAAGGIAMGISLIVRPPYGLVATADRLAIGLSTAFLLAPAGRFGYFALPIFLVIWARLMRWAPAPPTSADVAPSSSERTISASVGVDR